MTGESASRGGALVEGERGTRGVADVAGMRGVAVVAGEASEAGVMVIVESEVEVIGVGGSLTTGGVATSSGVEVAMGPRVPVRAYVLPTPHRYDSIYRIWERGERFGSPSAVRELTLNLAGVCTLGMVTLKARTVQLV